MKCIVIDDEDSARAIIGHLAKNNEITSIEADFSSAIQAIKYLNSHTVDLVFLDIHMPDFSGFDFIKTLKDPPKIILTTSDKNFALQAFEYECIVDYLVKPVSQKRFDKGVKRAAQKKRKTPNTFENPVSDESIDDLYINIDRRLIKVDIQSIKLVQAKGDYIVLKTDQEDYTVHTTLKKLEGKLPADTFIKVHRSYIINIKRIIDIEDNSLLIDKDVIPISRSNRAELMRRLNLL